MKKVLVMAALAALVATSASAITIVGTKHDLTAADTGNNDQICVYCHTPHSSNTAVTLAPLWNRDTTMLTAAGEVYSSTTLDYTATYTAINGTDAPLCLSCHDGAVGNALTNPPNITGWTSVVPDFTGNAVIFDAAQQMKNDHPIGMDIPATGGADTGIRDVADIYTAGLPAGALRGAGNTVWCSSCHDVHDNAIEPFLIMNNTGSDLCLACHNK
jgi:predicted CXXCH cytochrome family protein